MKLLTTEQVARELGVSQRRVRAMITAGRLKAEMIDRAWRIRPRDLEPVRVRKVGRPPKRDK